MKNVCIAQTRESCAGAPLLPPTSAVVEGHSRTPACVSSAQRWVMNSPPAASFSAWISTLLDGARKRTNSAQKSASTFHLRSSGATPLSSLPSLPPSCRIVQLLSLGRTIAISLSHLLLTVSHPVRPSPASMITASKMHWLS
ncbi:hypothetical protein PVAP13_4NG021981 [Panicum virgatum]|uniref:Uncharacterized protein n=1 Tax=Panicum virgatum TaxID=38727 RepID=A0A8T0SWL1_PANVG|nr:hypothetical protein PVAP13_4NG021981 [Panicum virgatum]